VSANPYSPPEASVADAVVADTPPPKPWAVTVMQVVGPVLLVAVSYAVVRNFMNMLQWQKAGVDITRMLTNYSTRAVIPLLLLYMLFQLPKRTQLGRWLGILLIALIIAVPLYFFVFVNPVRLSSSAAAMGQLIGFLITTLPFLYWLYAFGFSKKARAYFRTSARK